MGSARVAAYLNGAEVEQTRERLSGPELRAIRGGERGAARGRHHRPVRGGHGGRPHQGRAVQVDPIKSTLKAPGSWIHALESKIRWTGFKLCFQFQLAPLHEAAEGRGGGQQQPRHEVLSRGGGRRGTATPFTSTLHPINVDLASY